MPEFSPFTLSAAELIQTKDLLKFVFPASKIFSPEYLDWLYLKNPCGVAIGINAWENSSLIGHYALVPMRAWLKGKERSGLLSLNTAVTPAARHRGLFVGMAQRSFELAAAAGYEFVVGVAIANSAPGFVGRLGFSDLGGLQARVFTGAGPKSSAAPQEIQGPSGFYSLWTPRRILWRLNNPSQSYYAISSATGSLIVGKTPFVGFKSVLSRRTDLQNEVNSILQNSVQERPNVSLKSIPWAPFTVWTGLLSQNDVRGSDGILIPGFCQPSPLRLIFKSLQGRDLSLTPGQITIEPLDFDAF